MYIKLVFFEAICSFFVSISGCLGLHTERNASCYIQAILSNYFQLASIFWCVIMLYGLYSSVVLQNSPISNFKNFHMFCWGIPLIATFLHLTTNTFGPISPGEADWCFIVSTSSSPNWLDVFWVIATIYFWWFSSIVAMVYFYVTVVWRLNMLENPALSKNVNIALEKLKYYPIILVSCWICTAYGDIVDSAYPNEKNYNDGVYFCAIVLPQLCGLLNAAAFFSSNSNVAQLWYVFITEDLLSPERYATSIEFSKNPMTSEEIVLDKSYTPPKLSEEQRDKNTGTV